MLKHQTEIRTRYSETDQMTYIYNGKYFEYFEVGRAELMRENNLTYREIENMGYYMPVIECNIKYVSPAFYDELLIIETRMERLPTSRIHLDHTIFSKERNVVVAEGFVELAFLKKETRKLSRPPEFFINVMKKYFE